MALASDGESVACPICGATETRTRYVKSGYAIGACTQCGLVHANPRAPQAKILGRYSADYFWKEYLPSLGITGPDFDLARFDVRYGHLLAMLGQRARGRRLLEVGSGAGFFLKAAARAGWDVTGIELSDEAARFAVERLGLDIRRQPAEEASIAPGSFDAAVMFDTIEHLFDPRTVLQAVAQALTADGVLAVSTPNFDAASRFLLGQPWAVLSPLEHVYYFTEDSLKRLLLASGFRDVRFVRRHAMWGPMETMNYHYTHAPGAWQARLAAVLVKGGGMALARALQTIGRQDALLCFARR
ncbi:MAG: class I SAM-dependent methyltransferase [Vicinamibacterales bacterium]